MASPKWVLVEGVYLLIAGGILFAAFKAKSDWVRAGLGAFAISVIAFRLLAVLPSWWLYYAEGQLRWGGQGCTSLDAQCLKQAIKDTVVVIENGAAFGAFLAAFWIYQKKFPKQPAPGEAKLETTGGYK